MFRIGQKVVALKSTNKLIKGEIYTTTIVSECACGLIIIGVEGVSRKGQSNLTDCHCKREHKNFGYALYSYNYFRPIDEAFGKNIAAELEQQFAFESDHRTEHAHR